MFNYVDFLSYGIVRNGKNSIKNRHKCYVLVIFGLNIWF